MTGMPGAGLSDALLGRPRDCDGPNSDWDAVLAPSKRIAVSRKPATNAPNPKIISGACQSTAEKASGS